MNLRKLIAYHVDGQDLGRLVSQRTGRLEDIVQGIADAVASITLRVHYWPGNPRPNKQRLDAAWLDAMQRRNVELIEVNRPWEARTGGINPHHGHSTPVIDRDMLISTRTHFRHTERSTYSAWWDHARALRQAIAAGIQRGNKVWYQVPIPTQGFEYNAGYLDGANGVAPGANVDYFNPRLSLSGFYVHANEFLKPQVPQLVPINGGFAAGGASPKLVKWLAWCGEYCPAEWIFCECQSALQKPDAVERLAAIIDLVVRAGYSQLDFYGGLVFAFDQRWVNYVQESSK